MDERIIEFYFSENIKEVERLNFDSFSDVYSSKLTFVREDIESYLYEFYKDSNIIAEVGFHVESYSSNNDNLRIRIVTRTEINETEIERLKMNLKEYFLKDYYRICFWLIDYQAEQYHEELTKAFYKLENEFRNFINIVMIRNEGPYWFQEESPRRLKKLYKERSQAYKEAVSSFSDVDDSLYSLLTDDLVNLLDDDREVFPKELSEKQLERLYTVLDLASQGRNTSAFVKILKSIQIKKKSIYDIYFSDLVDRQLLNEWRAITKIRNHIAHNKIIDILLRNEFKIQMKNFSIMLVEATRKLEMMNPSDQEVYFRKILQESEEAINMQFAELESGVTVSSTESIIELMSEIIDNAIDELYEYFSERSDFEIKQNNSYKNMKDFLLLKVLYKPKGESLEIRVDNINIDNDPGSNSEITLRVDGYEELFKEYSMLEFTNGEYEFNEEQSNYLPVTAEYVNENKFYEEIEHIKEKVELEYPNLLEDVQSLESSYYHVTSGGNQITLEYEECPECGEMESLTTEEEYFEKLEKEYTDYSAICLSCGSVIEVTTCKKCNEVIIGSDNDSLCTECFEFIQD